MLFFVEHGAGCSFVPTNFIEYSSTVIHARRQAYGRMEPRVDTGATATMLASNYAYAQGAAVGLWATRGFGKDTLTSPVTSDQLRSLLDRQGSTASTRLAGQKA